MKISHRTENACIIENKKYVFSNLTKNEVEQILATQANSINSRIFEQEDLEFMQNFADAMNEPYQNRWAKYIELLSDGKLKDSRKDDPKFPTEEVKEILKDKKDWMNEFADELIMEYMCYHTGF